MNTRNPLMLLVLLLGIVPASQAQFKSMFSKNKPGRSQFQPYSSVGFGIGTSHYYGDLAPYLKVFRSTANTLRWNVTGNYTRHFTPRLSARIGLTIARLGADDNKYEGKRNAETQFVRNLHFRNDVKELSVVGMYNFVPTDRNYSRRPQLQPYAFTGLVIFAHNPKAKTPEGGFLPDQKQEWIALQPLGTEGQGQPGYAEPYSLVQVGIPLGLGVRYKINQRWDVSAEAGLRVTFTKYLDDVGGNYADPNDFPSVDSPGALLGNRSLEYIAARTGRDRSEPIRQILIRESLLPNNFIGDPFTISPSTNPVTGYSFAPQPGAPRSSSSYPDSYLLTNFTVHYILPGNIKCPPLK